MIQSHTLPNGMSLVAEPTEGVRTAAYCFLIPAGSVRDPEGRYGLANLVGAALHRGAGGRDARQLQDALDAMGVRASGRVEHDFASHGGVGLSDSLVPALELCACVLRQADLTEAEWESERLLALHDIEAAEEDPGTRLGLEWPRQHWGDAWGHPTLGVTGGVRAADCAAGRAFWHAHYQPRGAILGVAGCYEWPKLVAAFERLFGDWAPRELPSLPERRRGAHLVHLERPTEQVQLEITWDSVPVASSDRYSASGLAAVLGGSPSARLFEYVREKHGLCYAVHAAYSAFHRWGTVSISAAAKSDRVDETAARIFEVLELLRGSIGEDEVGRMRARVKSRLAFLAESTRARAGTIAMDQHCLGRVRPLAEVEAGMDAVTPARLHAFLDTHPLADPTLASLGPAVPAWPPGLQSRAGAGA